MKVSIISDIELTYNKISYCDHVVFNYKVNKNIVGDIGVQTGNYAKYITARNSFTLEWNLIEIGFDLGRHYLGDPQYEKIKPPSTQAQSVVFQQCKTENARVYIAREIVSLLWSGDKVKFMIVE